MIRIILRLIAVCALLFIAFVLIVVVVRTASHNRDWEMGQEELPRIVFDGTRFTIENLRDFEWTGPFEATPNYIEDSFDLQDIQRVDVIISHFSDFEGLAHIFLSFGFNDGRHVSVSLESRREKDEKFSPFWGLLDQFEMMYVVATDRDIIGLRTGHRNERVYIYETVATAEQAQGLFVRLAENINDIYATPVMYNTLFHNCTNEITREVEKMTTVNFPLTYKSILPGYFDDVLYESGVIDVSKSFNDIRRASLVNNSLIDENDKNFAVRVREVVGK